MIAHLFEPLDRLGRAWLELMAAVAIQAVALAILALAASWLLRRCSPAGRHGLWMIVAFKLLVMPLWCPPIAGPVFMSLHLPVGAEAEQGRSGDGPLIPAMPRISESETGTASGLPVRIPSRQLSWSWPLSWPPTFMLVWLGNAPRVVVTDVASSPFVCGLLRPTLVLPAHPARNDLSSRVAAHPVA